MARIYDERGDAENAERLYRQAVTYNPAMFDAWYLLGNLLKRRGAYVEAEQAYRNGLQQAPQNVAIRTNLGNLYLVQLKRPDDAVAMYRAAIDEMAKQPAAKFSPLPYLSLGVALHQTGDVDGARRALEFAARSVGFVPEEAPRPALSKGDRVRVTVMDGDGEPVREKCFATTPPFVGPDGRWRIFVLTFQRGVVDVLCDEVDLVS